VVDIVAEDGMNRHLRPGNARRRNGAQAVSAVGSIHPISYDELMNITKIWWRRRCGWMKGSEADERLCALSSSGANHPSECMPEEQAVVAA